MANLQTLSVSERTERGKGPCYRLRKEGMVPGVYYDQNGENISVKVKVLPLSRLYNKLGSSQVFELAIEKGGATQTKPALIWAVRFDPVKPVPQHVDFRGVDLDKEIRVHVPFEIVGKAAGVVKGGVVELFRDNCEVIGKPLSIPEKLVIDVTDLDLNQNVHIADVKYPEGVRGVFDDNYAVVGVVLQAAEAEPAAEGAAAPAEAKAEPKAEGK